LRWCSWVRGLPGSNILIPSFGTGPLLLASAGLVVVCLLKTPLRWAGAVMAVIATVWALRTPQPDVLVAPDGAAFALRTTSGHLAMIKTGSDTFAIREWLLADADPRDPKDKALGDGIACDPDGCVGRLADGAQVAISQTVEAFEEDCRRTALIVTARVAPSGCETLGHARVIDRKVWRQTGALALRRVGNGFELIPARPAGYARPWSRALAPPATGSSALQPAPEGPAESDAPPDVDD
jgi:competence protein ComEC